MSGFENYPEELAGIDRQIRRYAALCGVDLNRPHEVHACLDQQRDNWAEDKPRESLRGLLLLRMTLEAEMIEQGITVAPLSSQDAAGAEPFGGS